jgi:GT2 family glycosyltransferase
VRPRARQSSSGIGVSVIMPAFESWPALHRTVSAVLWDLRQLRLSWQLLVIDNESAPWLVQRLRRLGRPGEAFEVLRRSELLGRHFQPGAARNLGIDRARHECLIFLDADCVPGWGAIQRYVRLVSRDQEGVFIGHRVFVDADGLDADAVARDRNLLDRAPRVASRSNYGEVLDRRLAELVELDDHPRPYDCLYACNFALHRSCLGDLRFDPSYDGFWGYEDIDLGYRLHREGRPLRYAAEAFVFHQETIQMSDGARRSGRLRNLALLERRCPGFIAYRLRSRRAGALPEEVRASLAAGAGFPPRVAWVDRLASGPAWKRSVPRVARRDSRSGLMIGPSL